jgi:hypothetical protein
VTDFEDTPEPEIEPPRHRRTITTGEINTLTSALVRLESRIASQSRKHATSWLVVVGATVAALVGLGTLGVVMPWQAASKAELQATATAKADKAELQATAAAKADKSQLEALDNSNNDAHKIILDRVDGSIKMMQCYIVTPEKHRGRCAP